MDIPVFISLFETVGIPVLTAAAAGYGLWWLIRWLTGSFRQELQDEHEDIVKSMNIMKAELEEELRECKVILIRLVDRIRVLEVNFIEHDETSRATYGLTRATRKKPRHEVVAELQEQIKDAGRTNGDDK